MKDQSNYPLAFFLVNTVAQKIKKIIEVCLYLEKNNIEGTILRENNLSLLGAIKHRLHEYISIRDNLSTRLCFKLNSL